MIEDIDKYARDLPRMTLHGRIPTGTIMQLAMRVVELLEEVSELKGEAKSFRDSPPTAPR